jgi:hypothetical protein
MERIQISEIYHRRCIQIGEENVLYRGFGQIYEELFPIILFFSCIFSEITVKRH